MVVNKNARMVRRIGALASVAVLFFLTACGPTGTGPFGVVPGASETTVISALKDRGYCAPPRPFRERERFERCGVAGLELFSSWVEISIENERIVRLARSERHPSDDAATRRWNQLVSERAERVGQNAALLRELGELPRGAISWSSWTVANTVFAVILVRNTDPKTGNVLVIARDKPNLAEP